MIRALTFTVPWDALCSDNRKYKFRFVLSDKYRGAKDLIGTLGKDAAVRHHWPLAVVDLGLYVLVRPPDRRSRDLNLSKCAKDGITQGGGVWEDDKQVRQECWIFDPPSKTNAGATITIWRLDDYELPRRVGGESAGLGRAGSTHR